MQIKDIVNRDIVNLTNCENEPIHVPGSIQPHGFLIGIKVTDGGVDYCTENILAYTNLSHLQLLGKKIAELPINAQVFLNYLEASALSQQSPLMIYFNEIKFSCVAHQSDTMYIAEFEPAEETAPDLNELYTQNLQSIASLQTTESFQQLCQHIADQIKKQTGYDRVMIYRFDENYNGEVFAESVEGHLEHFFGLHYPHTDIPVQARQLYMKNMLRLIVDIGYVPVPIYTIDDAPDKKLDLGMANLRSVSPIHVQYLENMGVGATLTISLLHEERLWGLVACHHYSAKNLSSFSRLSAQLLGHLLTSQIKVRAVAEEYQLSQLVNASLENLLAGSYVSEKDSFNNIISKPELLSICRASGVAILFNGRIYKNGDTPGDEFVQLLTQKLPVLSRKGHFVTNKLLDHFADASQLSTLAAGIIYHSLSDLHPDCIIWFRKETLQEVHWAGDPQKAIVKNEKGLFPRKSFELWREIIKGRSNPWANPEVTAASSFAHSLQKHVLFLLLSEEESKYRKLSRELQEANAELENINWISTHDLQEPLRKIQLFSSRMLEKDEMLSGRAAEYIQKMNDLANRMQRLIQDLTSYSKIKHNEGAHVETDLNIQLQELVTELHDEIEEIDARIEVDDLPVIKGVPLLLKQLFTNLIRNSIKFRQSSKTLHVHISSQNFEHPDTGRNYYRVTVSDNGIGFENEHRNDIFKIFSRLHNQSLYNGSGIGLSLCKQIMDIHKGFIEANGIPGEAASFMMFFPVLES